MGRKATNDNSENKNSRITVYITKTLYDDISDLARLNRKTLASYINNLIEDDVKKYSDRLEKFRELAKDE